MSESTAPTQKPAKRHWKLKWGLIGVAVATTLTLVGGALNAWKLLPISLRDDGCDQVLRVVDLGNCRHYRDINVADATIAIDVWIERSAFEHAVEVKTHPGWGDAATKNALTRGDALFARYQWAERTSTRVVPLGENDFGLDEFQLTIRRYNGKATDSAGAEDDQSAILTLDRSSRRIVVVDVNDLDEIDPPGQPDRRGERTGYYPRMILSDVVTYEKPRVGQVARDDYRGDTLRGLCVLHPQNGGTWVRAQDGWIERSQIRVDQRGKIDGMRECATYHG